MKGDVGPYGNEDGDVLVPRTVPYLEARTIAKSGFYDARGDRLTYVGKGEADLFGFTRDCDCDEVCEGKTRCETCDHPDEWHTGGKSDRGCEQDYPEPCKCVDYSDPGSICAVPAWHFRLVER